MVLHTSYVAINLVVARYGEDLRWVRNTPPQMEVVVYNKGTSATEVPSQPLPNLGREAHTYLHYLATQYEALPEIVVFCQGHPFDHAPDLHRFLRGLVSGALTVELFHWLGFLIDTDDARGRRCFVPWSKNPTRAELPLDLFYREMFGQEPPELFHFHGGAQFAVTRACVLRRPLSFYLHALKLAETFPEAAHCFERCWDRIFDVRGVDPAILDGEGRAFLKRVKKREST